MKPKTIYKVLVIRFSSIGDIVLTTPVIRCLKNQFPGIEIHYLTKKQYHPILLSNPFISKIWLFEDNFHELVPQLKAENFDFIVDLHKNFRSRYVLFKLWKPNSSFPKLNFRKWLMVNFKLNCLPDIHIVDRYFVAVKKLGVINDGKGLDYFIPEEEEVGLFSILPEPGKGYIALSIGGKHVTKILPDDLVILICDQAAKPVILLGGMEDKARAERIALQASHPVLNACGLYSLNQSASLIRQADKVISNDTGLMHIAAAFRKPVVSVWGNTVPGFGMYPYFPGEFQSLSQIFEVPGLSCRPCSKLGFRKCPKGHFRCMKDQDVRGIVKSINC